MRFRFLLCLLPLATVVTYRVAPPPAVWADEDTDTKQARRRFQEGVRSFDAKKYEEARVAFLQALALKPHPSIVLNLAACEAAMRTWKDAAGHYEQYLQMPETTDVGRIEAEKGLAEAKRQLAAAEAPPAAPEASAAPAASATPPPPPVSEGVLILRSTKDGTQFQLAAGAKPPPGSIGVTQPTRPLCVAPCEAPVSPGEVEVLTDGPGQVGGSRRIVVSAGERRMVTVQPGSSTMRLAGWGLVGLGSLGTVVSLLTKDSGALTAGSIVAGLGGGGLVVFSRSEIKDVPAPKAALVFRINGSF